MATINTVKLCNINIDGGDKLIPHNTFSFQGLQSLFILENGGGKTTFIQLVLQVILPETSTGKRRLDETLMQGKNGFIIVEWNLDDKGERRLITGFSFENRKEAGSGKSSLRFYTYTIEYPKAGFSINDLPVYSEKDGRKHVTPYEEFRDKVKNITKVPATVYNSKRVKEYQAELREHGIFPEEWENIKRINVTEGAADAFFERADTVTKLLERLFIPSLEKAMFSDDENGSTLTDAFYKFQENLLKIPDIQKNIRDFSVVEDNVEGVILSVEEYEAAKKGFYEKKNYLLKLAETYNRSIQKNKAEISLKQEELTELNNEAKVLNWKLDSYSAYVQQKKVLDSKEKLASLQENFKTLICTKESANRQKRELKATRAYNRRSELFVQREGLLSSINNLEKADDELKKLVDQMHEEASFSWFIREKELIDKKQEVTNELITLSGESKSIKSEIESLNSEAKQLSESKVEIDFWFKELNKSKESLLSWFDEWELLNPQDCLDKSASELEALLVSKNNYSNAISSGYHSIGVLKDELIEKRLEKNRTENNIESANNKLQEYFWRKDVLSSWLSSYGSVIPSNQNELDEVLVHLRNELADKEKDQDRFSNEVRVLIEDLSRLKETPYFVPNKQIEEVRRYLDKKNIFGSLGSEWLSEQNLSEEEKAEILNKIPLLPYSILVESTQIRDIPKELNRIQWKSSSPIIFIDKEELLRVQDSESNQEKLNLVTSHKNTWIYQNIDVNLFVGKEKLKELIIKNEEQLAKAQNVVEEVKGKRANCEKTIELTKDFYADYSFNYEVDKTSEQNQLKKVLAEIEEGIGSLVATQENLDKEIVQWKIDLENTETKVKDAEEKHRNIKEYVNNSVDEPMFSQKLKELIHRNHGINNKQKDLRVRLNQISDIVSQLQKQENSIDMQKQQYNNEQSKFVWKSGVVVYGPPIDYELAKGLYEASKEDLNREYRELKVLQDSLIGCNRSIEREEEDIKENEIEYSWLESNKRAVTNEEISAAVNLESELQKKMDPMERQVSDVKEVLNKLEGALENTINSLKDKYGKDPYRYTDESEHNHFAFLQEELEEKRDLLVDMIGSLENKVNTYDKSYEVLKSNLPDLVEGVIEPLMDFDCEVQQLVSFTNQQITEFKDSRKIFAKAKDLVNDRFSIFKGLLEDTDNIKIKQLARQFDLLLAEERLFDSNYVIEKFTRVLEASNIYKGQLEQTKVEVDKDRIELIEMAISRVSAIYGRIIEMPKSSRLSLYGRDLQAIRLKWDRLLDQEAKYHMSRHIEEVVENINEKIVEGASQEEIKRYIYSQLDTRVLMKYYAPFHQCRIEIYKPKKEQVMRDKNKRIEYAPWEIAVKWSGGEQYTVYMTMFMVYIMHIRQAESGRDKVAFTIIVDNPFGKASNDHVVDPILETAKKNNIQLICLTAHDAPRIISKFPVVYSNVYNYEPNAQLEILESEFKETLETMKYVNYEELTEQLSLV